MYKTVLVLALGLLVSPLFVLAAPKPEICGYQAKEIRIENGDTKRDINSTRGVYWPAGSLIPCKGTAANPATVNDVGSVIIRITNWILGIAGAIAVLFIIWGGLLYLTAAGNEKQVASAKLTLKNAIIGLIVILLSGVILLLVSNTANFIIKN